MQVDLILTSKDTLDKKLTTSITYVNPSVDNSKLRELAVALNDLTTNSYYNTTKETKEDLL